MQSPVGSHGSLSVAKRNGRPSVPRVSAPSPRFDSDGPRHFRTWHGFCWYILRMIDIKNAIKILPLALLLTSPTVWADDDDSDKPGASNWPLAVTERPLTLSRNMVEIDGDTLNINMSSGQIGRPISLAPDIWYGVNNSVTVGITHDRGLCLNGGCKYNDTGLQARVHLLGLGKSEIAASFGIHMPRFSDPFAMGASAGLISRLTFGKLALRIDPRIYVGILGRDYRSEQVDVPVQIQYLINPNTTAYLLTGLTEGTLQNFVDNAKVPAGLGFVVALNNRFDVGGEFRFDNVAGPAANKGRGRALLIRAALRI